MALGDLPRDDVQGVRRTMSDDADARQLRNRQLDGQAPRDRRGHAGLRLTRWCRCTGRSARRSASRQTRIVAPVNTQVDASREVTVELLASTAGGLPWKFEALDREVTHAPGRARDGALPRDQHAGPRRSPRTRCMNTAPMNAARWIVEAGVLLLHQPDASRGRDARDAGGVPRELPDAPRDVDTISLSYTFFELPAGAS